MKKNSTIIVIEVFILIVGLILFANSQVQKPVVLAESFVNTFAPQEHRGYIVFFRMKTQNDNEFLPACYATAGPSKIMARPGDTVIWEIVPNDICSTGVSFAIEFVKNVHPFVKLPVYKLESLAPAPGYGYPYVESLVAQIAPNAGVSNLQYKYSVRIQPINTYGYPVYSPGSSGLPIKLEDLWNIGAQYQLKDVKWRYKPYPRYRGLDLPYIQVSQQ